MFLNNIIKPPDLRLSNAGTSDHSYENQFEKKQKKYIQKLISPTEVNTSTKYYFLPKNKICVLKTLAFTLLKHTSLRHTYHKKN